MKYLLVKFAKRTGYWDTSGYCEWSRDEHFSADQFDLDDEQGVIEAIGKFTSKYDNGEVYLSKVEGVEWGTKEYDQLHAIVTCGRIRGEELKKEEKEKKRQKEIKERAAEKIKEEERELAQLKRLQEKYNEARYPNGVKNV